MPMKFEVQTPDVEVETQGVTIRQPYSAPTVETLDVGMTRGKGATTVETINPVSGS
jgi:hypothetical protein